MARLRLAVLWTLASACAREAAPARDVATYGEILANAGQDPEAGKSRCELTAAVMLTEPLERILRQQGLLQQFCALSPPRAQDVAGLLGVAPSAALDQALVEQQPMLCGAGGAPALSSGLRTSVSQPNQVAPGW